MVRLGVGAASSLRDATAAPEVGTPALTHDVPCSADVRKSFCLLGFMGLAQLSYSNKSQENLKSPYKWMAKG
jgi:hypothetical protein